MFFNWHKITVFLIFFCVSITIEAQEFTTIENVTKGTKLQNHNFLDITQDAQGYLWIGTNWGLYKYDGYQFKPYTAITTSSFINNNIKTLLVQGDNLWIGMKSGINIINTNTNSRKSITSANKNGLSSDYVTKLYKDKSNSIWVGYNTDKLSRYIGNFKFQHFDLKINYNNMHFIVNDIVETRPNTFYIKLLYKTINISHITIIEAKYNGKNLSTKIIKEGVIDNLLILSIDNKLHMIEKNLLYRFNEVSGSFKLVNNLFSKDSVENLTSYTDKTDKIYIGTKNKSFYNLNKETYAPQNYTLISDSETSINTFFKDNSGLLWAGTTSGLFKIKKSVILFKKHLQETSLGYYNKMHSIIQDKKGDIYAVNQTNIFKYDTINKEFIDLKWENKNNSVPYVLLENDENSLLVGTQGSGISIYNKITNVCKPYFENHRKLSNNHIIKLYRDAHDILWIGTLDGLYYFDEKNDSLVKIQNSDLQEAIDANESIFEIKPFKDNQLWIGTNIGLYLLKVDYSVFPFQFNTTKIEAIPYAVRSILMDNDIVWIATQTNGLLKYHSKTHKLTQINETNGLSNNTVNCILPGENHEIWLGTINGLSRYNTITKQFLNYYDYDGLADNEFNASSQLKARNGDLFFGGRNGISQFTPSNFNTGATNFNLNISSISWFNSKIDSTFIIDMEYRNNKSLELPFNNAFVNFKFSLTDYFKPDNNTFKYKISGLNRDWRMLNKTNILSFTNLPPGNYNLEVKASTNYGKWNNQGITIPIIVEQIYYKRWWFITACGFLILLIFYFIRKYELSHIKKLENLRLQISRDLHDELGSALTGIAIRSELLKDDIGVQSKNKVLDEIAEQSRSAVDSLSDIVWAIDSRNNSIQNLSERMETILYLLLKPLNITYTFETLHDRKPLFLKQDYRQHIYLIFKEAVTNIVKHSNATHVNIAFTREENKIKLKINDNGTIVSKPNTNLSGYGIENMRMRAKKINGAVQISTTNGFTILLCFDCLG
ncbi:MAG TPA: two-component regulator propeller domain-containing protein [Lutibacter sp.]